MVGLEWSAFSLCIPVGSFDFFCWSFCSLSLVRLVDSNRLLHSSSCVWEKWYMELWAFAITHNTHVSFSFVLLLPFHCVVLKQCNPEVEMPFLSLHSGAAALEHAIYNSSSNNDINTTYTHEMRRKKMPLKLFHIMCILFTLLKIDVHANRTNSINKCSRQIHACQGNFIDTIRYASSAIVLAKQKKQPERS